NSKLETQNSKLKTQSQRDYLADLRPGGVVPRPECVVPVACNDPVRERRLNEPVKHAPRRHVAEMPFGRVEQRPARGYHHYLRQLPPGNQVDRLELQAGRSTEYRVPSTAGPLWWYRV